MHHNRMKRLNSSLNSYFRSSVSVGAVSAKSSPEFGGYRVIARERTISALVSHMEGRSVPAETRRGVLYRVLEPGVLTVALGGSFLTTRIWSGLIRKQAGMVTLLYHQQRNLWLDARLSPAFA
jgi:hypothetical protein